MHNSIRKYFIGNLVTAAPPQYSSAIRLWAQSFCALITTYYAIHGNVQTVCGCSRAYWAYDSLLIGWVAFKNVTQQTFWSLTTWLKCWSFLLFTTFVKSLSVPICSSTHWFWNLLCSVFISISTCQMPLTFLTITDRPISNLSVLSKLLERLVVRQLMEYLSSAALLPFFQSRFRQGHSTETAILRVLSDILHEVDRGILLLWSFWICRQHSTLSIIRRCECILLRRLQLTFGIDGIAHRWFYSYLSSRKQYVRRGPSRSSVTYLTCGVPQCISHCPMLFVLSGWPLTWKTWKSQGISKWSGKSQGKWKKSGKLKFVFWTLNELKSWSCSFWQLVGLDFGYVHHWHSCSF